MMIFLNDYLKVIREFANKMLEVLEKIVSLFPGNEFNGTDESLKNQKELASVRAI